MNAFIFKKDKNKLLIFRNLDWFICYLYIINHHLGSANRMVFFRLKCEVQKGVNKHTYAENLEVDVPEVTFPKIMCNSAKQFWKGVWERLTRFLCSRKKKKKIAYLSQIPFLTHLRKSSIMNTECEAESCKYRCGP